MINVIGDSHANSFKGFGIKVIYLGAVTLKRMSYPDYLIDKEIHKARFGWKYFIFGEIDIRCHPIAARNIGETVERHCNKLEKYGNKIGLISVPPPAPKERAEGGYPVFNSDERRIELTHSFNKYLQENALKRDWKYLDLSCYADENGFLKEELSDGNVHIKDKNLKNLLKKNVKGY